MPACESLLSPASQKARFNEMIGILRGLGLRRLTEAYDQRQVEVSFRPKRWPWQHDIDWRNTILGGKRILIIRNLQWEDEAARQRALWELGEALYRLELDKKLWSTRSMVNHDRGIGRVNGLQADLYRLLDNLPRLRAADVLPERDPGRWWALYLALGVDASKSIFPNLMDFRARRTSGPYAAADASRERNSRSLLFNSYMDWLKRLTVIGMLAQGVVSAPYLAELPGYVDAQMSWITGQQQQTEVVSTPVAESQLPSTARIQVQSEKLRLEKAIHAEQNKLNADAHEIDRLKAEYKSLIDLYPWLVLTPSFTAPVSSAGN